MNRSHNNVILVKSVVRLSIAVTDLYTCFVYLAVVNTYSLLCWFVESGYVSTRRFPFIYILYILFVIG